MTFRHSTITLETLWDPVTLFLRLTDDTLDVSWAAGPCATFRRECLATFIVALQEARSTYEAELNQSSGEKYGWVIDGGLPSGDTIVMALSGDSLLFSLSGDCREETQFRLESVGALAKALEDLHAPEVST